MNALLHEQNKNAQFVYKNTGQRTTNEYVTSFNFSFHLFTFVVKITGIINNKKENKKKCRIYLSKTRKYLILINSIYLFYFVLAHKCWNQHQLDIIQYTHHGV